jgi:hypothetical protein
VRPAHLEPVPPGENTRRGKWGNHQREKTHCPKGHPYDEANTRRYRHITGGMARQCRACHREATRLRRRAARPC